MTDRILLAGALIAIGYTFGFVAARLVQQRAARRRIHRIRPRDLMTLSIRAPRGPQAVRREVAHG